MTSQAGSYALVAFCACVFGVAAHTQAAPGDGDRAYQALGVSDQKVLATTQKGSLLILPKVELRWNADGELIQDTFIGLMNDYPEDVSVQLYYVAGDPELEEATSSGARTHPGWTADHLDAQAHALILSANQPTYWSVHTGLPAAGQPLPSWTDLDPSGAGELPGRPDPEGSTERVLRGYILAWAVEQPHGQEIRWNHLSAEVSIVDYPRNATWSYRAYAAQALGVAHGEPIHDEPADAGNLQLNGVDYEQARDRLLMDFYAVGAGLQSDGVGLTVADTDLTLLPIDADLRTINGGPRTVSAQFSIWNADEVGPFFHQRCITGWDEALLSHYAPAESTIFMRQFLGTDKGIAVIDGQTEPGCPESAAVALIGVQERLLEFATASSSAGLNLVGIGTDATAVIRADVESEPLMPRARVNLPATSNRLPAAVERTGADRTGSLLVFPAVEVAWQSTPGRDGYALVEDTFVEITNHHADAVTLQLYLVNGDPPMAATNGERDHPGWNWVEQHLVLAAQSTTYWSSSTGQPGTDLAVAPWVDLDPPGSGQPPGRPAPDGNPATRVLRGTLLVWAVNALGQEINWNHLSGAAMTANFEAGVSSAYTPYAFSALAGAHAEQTGTPLALHLDGAEYEMNFTSLLLEFYPTGSMPFDTGGAGVPFVATLDTDLTLMIPWMDLRPGDDPESAPPPRCAKARFSVWGANQTGPFAYDRCLCSWDQALLGNYPPLAQSIFMATVLQSDRGYARIQARRSSACNPYDTDDVPLLGLATRQMTFAAQGPLGAGRTGLVLPGFNIPTDPADASAAASIHYAADCNANSIPDRIDVSAALSLDCNTNGTPDECESDCNSNTIPDTCDITARTSVDCNWNSTPDACEVNAGSSADCNSNGVPDGCDLSFIHDCCSTGHGAGCTDPVIQTCVCDLDRYCCHTEWDQICVDKVAAFACGDCSPRSHDCGSNGIPDECETDCNKNGIADGCDVSAGTSVDCNTNQVPDECEEDCNSNGVFDGCDVSAGTSEDCNATGTPDECEQDCNGNRFADECDIAMGTSQDCDGDTLPDECAIAAGTARDCNGNTVPDQCDLQAGTASDCNSNGTLDECDLAAGTSSDFNINGIPDECDPDCNENDFPDFIDIMFGLSEDTNANGVPDECEDCNSNGVPDDWDIGAGTSADCNSNGSPDS
ncbi:MAG: hypothetical protein GY842_22130, partial [bacterium]|nr:hypothetical protein [bacterium]